MKKELLKNYYNSTNKLFFNEFNGESHAHFDALYGQIGLGDSIAFGGNEQGALYVFPIRETRTHVICSLKGRGYFATYNGGLQCLSKEACDFGDEYEELAPKPERWPLPAGAVVIAHENDSFGKRKGGDKIYKRGALIYSNCGNAMSASTYLWDRMIEPQRKVVTAAIRAHYGPYAHECAIKFAELYPSHSISKLITEALMELTELFGEEVKPSNEYKYSVTLPQMTSGNFGARQVESIWPTRAFVEKEGYAVTDRNLTTTLYFNESAVAIEALEKSSIWLGYVPEIRESIKAVTA